MATPSYAPPIFTVVPAPRAATCRLCGETIGPGRRGKAVMSGGGRRERRYGHPGCLLASLKLAPGKHQCQIRPGRRAEQPRWELGYSVFAATSKLAKARRPGAKKVRKVPSPASRFLSLRSLGELHAAAAADGPHPRALGLAAALEASPTFALDQIPGWASAPAAERKVLRAALAHTYELPLPDGSGDMVTAKLARPCRPGAVSGSELKRLLVRPLAAAITRPLVLQTLAGDTFPVAGWSADLTADLKGLAALQHPGELGDLHSWQLLLGGASEPVPTVGVGTVVRMALLAELSVEEPILVVWRGPEDDAAEEDAGRPAGATSETALVQPSTASGVAAHAELAELFG